MLRDAGHDEIADEIEADLVGRNVLQGRWTFQLVEEFDDGYYQRFKDHERRAREQLAGGVRHLYEAEIKASRDHARPPRPRAGAGPRCVTVSRRRSARGRVSTHDAAA